MTNEARRLAAASWRRFRRRSSRLRRRATRTFTTAPRWFERGHAPSPVLLDLARSAENREITSYQWRPVLCRHQPDVTVWRLASETSAAVAAGLVEGLSADELDSLRVLTVFEYVRCATTGKLYGAPEGCRIAVWDRHPARPTLSAPDRRSSVQEIDDRRPLPVTTRERWDGRRRPAWLDARHGRVTVTG